MSKIKNIYHNQKINHPRESNFVLDNYIKCLVFHGSRLFALLKTSPSKFFIHVTNEDIDIGSEEKMVIFWQYLGNNLHTIKNLENFKLNCMVIVDDAYEGLITDKKYEFIQKSLSKITDHWYVVTSNEKLFYSNVRHCQFHLMNQKFDNIDLQQDTIKFNIFNRQKKFLCLNNLPRLHRLEIVDFMLDKEIDKDSFLSCSNQKIIETVYDIDNPDLIEEKNSSVHQVIVDKAKYDLLDEEMLGYRFSNASKERLIKNLPIELDIPENERGKVKHFTPSAEEYFHESYWSIINERDFFEKEFLGFTEKVVKALFLYHPFIVVGLPYTLKKLRDYGFMTFSKYVDESYDNIEDNEKRMRMIKAEIIKLHQKSYMEHFNMYHDMKELLIHNHNNIKNLNKSLFPNKTINIIQDWYFLP